MEGDENNRQFNITEIQRGGYSLLVLNRGKEGQEDYCLVQEGQKRKQRKRGNEEKGDKIGKL
jgi:uncharacterized protein (UPF0128 family)